MATNDDIQLVDMLESYPSSMTPGFQTLITAKREFAELASDLRERLPPGRGKFFKHQRLTHRFLRAYDNLIVYDATGTGKSSSILGFTENVRREYEKAQIDPTTADEKLAHFKRTIVLVKGPAQKNEFRNQLICKASDGRYESALVKQAKSEKVQKRNITNEIKKAGYFVSTYKVFAHQIDEKYPTEADYERLAQDYSDTIFWFDEAHNLLIDTARTKKVREKQRIYHTLWRVLHLARRCKTILSTATPMINDEKELGSLMNLILPLNGVIPTGYDYRSAPPNDIRVLFPGLPFDYRTVTSEQMAPFFRGQFPSDYNFRTATLEDLEPFMRGRFTFVAAADTGAVPEEQGVLQEDEYEVNGVRYISQLVIYATEMSEHQSEGYVRAKYSVRGRDELFGAERQAANFVFPDGFWGNGITEDERDARREARRAKAAIKAALVAREGETEEERPIIVETLPEGGFIPTTAGALPEVLGIEDEETGIELPGFERRAFRRYVNLSGDTFSPTPEFAPWLTNLAYIRTLSCKYSEIVRLVSQEPGNSFVYGEFVGGSGAIVLALCLEGMGFTRYNETSSMFLGVGGESVKPFCSGAEVDVTTRRVKPNILSHAQGAPFRYALLTKDTLGPKFHSIMEAMNSYENRNGDYIKVLISSHVGRDAINVNNVLQIHLIGSEWNQSAMYQALSRGIRATSHEDLLNEERARIAEQGGDPNTASIKVKIYKHAAVALDEAQSSIDLQMYRMSEYKDRGIKRVMRIMKQVSIACQIHYDRNVPVGGIDGSAKCDYDVCRYQCVDPAPEVEDFTTYDVLYSDEVVANAVGEIINAYRQNNVLTIEEISSLLHKYRPKYLIMALEHLITNKVALTDRFGYTTYLREDKGAFYLDRSYPTGAPPSYAMAYYTQGVIGIEQETLANIVVRLEAGEHREILSELEGTPPEDPRFHELLDGLSVEGQAAVLEEVLLRVVSGNVSALTEAVVERFQSMLFTINEPVSELEKVYQTLATQRPKRGRKPKPETKRRTKKINPLTIDETNIVRDKDTELVYIHTLYSQVTDQTGYANTARFNKAEGRMRLLKPSEAENGWRDLNDVELPVYNAFIQIEIANRSQPFEDLGIYGFMLRVGGTSAEEFRIRDPTTQAAGAATDARLINRGKLCTIWNRSALIDVMWKIGAPAPEGMFPNFTEESRPQLINNILRHKKKTREELETWGLEQLVYYYKWYQANRVHRDAICEHIKQHMIKTGRLRR